MDCINSCVHGRCYHLDCGPRITHSTCCRPFICNFIIPPMINSDDDINVSPLGETLMDKNEMISLQDLMNLTKDLGVTSQVDLLSDKHVRAYYPGPLYTWPSKFPSKSP